MTTLEWTTVAEEELAEILVWVASHAGLETAERAREAIEQAALAAVDRPLRFPWVGAIFPTLARADQSYRRILAWDERVHLFYRWIEGESRVVILHVRGARRRPLGMRQFRRP